MPEPQSAATDRSDPVLLRVDGRSCLVDRSGPQPVHVCVDFLEGPTAHRLAGIRRGDHPLARAIGRKTPLPRVLDGTAGLGRDAFVLAALGYDVTACEREPRVHALLADGVRRLRADPGGAALVGDRLRVLECDCRRCFAGPRPEVVLLDPMFPERRKSSLVKKEMQLLQRLVGHGDPAADRELVAAARAAATARVVVKRPTTAPPLLPDVSFAVTGSRMRFDVYLA